MNEDDPPPILDNKDAEASSVFTPDGLLREARRQKGLAREDVPPLCVLDPDGDIVRHLTTTGAAQVLEQWACYHSTMRGFEAAGQNVGIIGCAVGAPYAVLLAEQMFASGCRLLLSITSSGELATLGPRPYYVLVERALRDEGTSYHYRPPSRFAHGDPDVLARVHDAIADCGPVIHRGATWTTDAPFRETQDVIDRGKALGLAAIEMESAALYSLAEARGYSIACLAHVTNAMATVGDDFEKGEAGGAVASLRLIEAVAANLDRILG